MQINVKFSQASFIAAMNQVSRETGLTLPTIMRSQMSLWAKSLIRLTYPKKKEDGEKAIYNEAGFGSKKAGDLMRLFQPVSDSDWDNPKRFYESASESGLPVASYIYRTKRGDVYGVEEEYIVDSIEEMRRHHQNNRGKNGRVTRAGSYSRNIGRWKFVNKYHVKWSKLRQYASEVIAHVGREKSGWLIAANYFGAKSDKLIDKGRIPKWVQRHSDWASRYSSYSESYNPQSISGNFAAHSSVPWAQYDGLLDLTLKMRIKDLRFYMTDRIRRILAKRSAKAA